MNMFCRGVAAGVLAALALMVWAPASRAEETLLLGLNRSAPAYDLTLDTGRDDDADAVLARGFRGGFGGFHGFHGGFHRGFGGFHGFHGGFHRGFGGFHGFHGGFHRGFGGFHSGF